MSDPVDIRDAANATVPIAADQVAGLGRVQITKPAFGPDGAATMVSRDNPMPVRDEDIAMMLIRMLRALESPQGYDRSLQRTRGSVVVESGTVTTVTTVSTVTTVTTVGAVTSVNNFDGYNARMPVLDNNRVAWAQCVRARIT